MAEVEIAPQFGLELKDGFKPVHAWVNNGIQWLDDIQQFYRERSVIEKEYSQKLSALAKKYYDKKTKKSSSLSVGDTPTVTPGSLESASMTTWATQLTTLESRATEHDKFGNQLISSLADPIKNLQTRYEELRKQHADYAGKLEKERDNAYADLMKTKGRYDSVCQEVENRRKKTESSFDHSKQKAQSNYQNQLGEMRNVKNTYLITINVTNKQKERYYHEYVPELLDSMQALNETRISTMNNLWSAAATIETNTMNNSAQLLRHLSSEIPRNNPVLDSMMFARHNAQPQWSDPPDFGFEPSPVWLDDDLMAADPASKTFLMNILTKSKSSLTELKREVDGRRKEVEGCKRVRQAIKEGKDKRDEVEIVRAQFYNQELLHDAERRRTTAEVEVSTIMSAVGDVSIGAKSHTFKNQTFKIPTNCDLCGDRIWGLSAKGLSCEECGFTCHTKCELKVPADCPGELNKEEKKKIKGERQAAAQAAMSKAPDAVNGADTGYEGKPALQRSDTIGSMNTLSSGYAASAQRSVSGATARSSTATEDGAASTPATTSSPASKAPTRNRIVAPPPTTYISSNGTGDESKQKGKMLYAFQASSGEEVSISDGAEFTVLEPDDGSGWVKIKPDAFGSSPGIVPASYVELLAKPTPSARPVSTATSGSASSVDGGLSGAAKPKPAAPPPRRGAKKVPAVKYVEALYTYSANGDGETDMEEGEKMVLLQADQGDGWCEVESKAGRGVVPASWVREV
jgi:formin-binding protein 1